MLVLGSQRIFLLRSVSSFVIHANLEFYVQALTLTRSYGFLGNERVDCLDRLSKFSDSDLFFVGDHEAV